MSRLKVLCTEDSPQVVALANRLDGELVNYLICDRGFSFSFHFPKDTFGEQFKKAIALYPEVIEVQS